MKVLDTNQIKQAAWDKLGSKWTNAVITLIIFTVIPMIISYPASSFENHSLNQNLWKIFDAAISSVLCIGVSAFFYDLVRNRNLDYKRLFVAFTRGWTFYLSALCVQILIPIWSFYGHCS